MAALRSLSDCASCIHVARLPLRAVLGRFFGERAAAPPHVDAIAAPLLEDGDEDVREAALGTIGALDEHPAPHVDDIVARLGSGDVAMRGELLLRLRACSLTRSQALNLSIIIFVVCSCFPAFSGLGMDRNARRLGLVMVVACSDVLMNE